MLNITFKKYLPKKSKEIKSCNVRIIARKIKRRFDLPHEEEKSGDKCRIFVKETYRPFFAGAIFASLQKYQVKQHANGMSESDKERVDGVRTEETDLTRRNRFPQQEMKRLPCSAWESPVFLLESFPGAEMDGAASPIWCYRLHQQLQLVSLRQSLKCCSLAWASVNEAKNGR